MRAACTFGALTQAGVVVVCVGSVALSRWYAVAGVAVQRHVDDAEVLAYVKGDQGELMQRKERTRAVDAAARAGVVGGVVVGGTRARARWCVRVWCVRPAPDAKANQSKGFSIAFESWEAFAVVGCAGRRGKGSLGEPVVAWRGAAAGVGVLCECEKPG